MAEVFELFVFSLEFSLEGGNSLFLFFNQFGEVSRVSFRGGLEISRGSALNGDISGSELGGLGLTVLSAEPFVGGQSRFARESRRIEIILEDIRFSWDSEDDGLDGVLGDFEESGDFARGGVEAEFGEKSHTTLRVVGFVFRQVEDVRIFIGDFKVSDVTISLSSKVEDVGVIVVEGHQNTRSSIDVFGVEGSGEGSRVPDGVLAFAGFGESEREELFFATEVVDSASFNTSMSFDFGGDSSSSGIDQTELLVFAGSGKLRTIVVPA